MKWVALSLPSRESNQTRESRLSPPWIFQSYRHPPSRWCQICPAPALWSRPSSYLPKDLSLWQPKDSSFGQPKDLSFWQRPCYSVLHNRKGNYIVVYSDRATTSLSQCQSFRGDMPHTLLQSECIFLRRTNSEHVEKMNARTRKSNVPRCFKLVVMQCGQHLGFSVRTFKTLLITILTIANII